MDNLCHTLVGAALGEAGLKRRTRFGHAVLMIAANIPDVDVLVFATGVPPVAFRRGWTHGVVAQLLLPLAVTAAAMAVARWRRPRAGDVALRPGWLLVLSAIGVVSHVFLDFLNNYGVRLLAPFDWRWFYGDALFIIDPWLWASLGAGVWLARRRAAPAPARGALVFAAAYVLLMLLSARAARSTVLEVWRDTRGRAPVALMVGPVPVSPFTRQVIVDAGGHYETGRFSWWESSVTFDPGQVPVNGAAPGVAAARETPQMRGFLTWTRFPYWTLTPDGNRTRVTLEDMRFSGRAGFSPSVVVDRVIP